MKFFVRLIILFLLVIALDGLSNSKKRSAIKAVKSNQTIIIDGILDEECWRNSQVVSGFIQRDPDEGKEATQQTEVRVLYDEGAIYISATLYDTAPDSIVARLARRDDYVESDLFAVYLDPYNDKRSGYYFALNAAGSYSDGILFNDDWDDDSWNGVWEGKVKLNNNGWSAEFKIPFSQLRFKDSDINEWGINFSRVIARRNEKSYYVYVPKNESGFVSHFVSLTGMENIKPGSQLEILPYITSKAEYTHPAANDPFNDGSKYLPGVGADIKMGIGSNLTLNATINPDFGQVEIDPAVINLSDVETYYSEKRPFFIEGASIFNFGQGGARSYWGFNWSNPNFFYSRRIGRVPEGSLPNNDFSDAPSGTHILGAAKLSGKLNGNWNIGTIQAVTKREYAEYEYNGNRFETEVEPLSYYGVFRVQKEFNEGFQGLGFMSTVTQRAFKDDRLRSEINSGAYTFGLDGWTFLDSSKTWVFTGWVGASNVTGTTERISSIQRSSRHYFQRPDAKNYSVDSSATSLNGYAMRFYINKQKGNFFVNTAFGMISPGFEINDLGFIWRTDQINTHIGAGYAWKDPTDFYRYLELGGAFFRTYDFDGNINSEGFFHFGSYQFLNYYSANWNLAYNPQT
ncbi:MAG: carbohydrate binding family 9 domain-containing protein, partial [Ignavibacteriaceae bacterium]|nr:carbohydrate binding family 9 domain-containing protein [Ignavibacteriaceae bacterium]